MNDMSFGSSGRSVEVRDAIPSTAAIRGHPLHPALVAFPIAALIGLLLSDCMYYFTSDAFWIRASYWLAGIGAFTGTIAGAAGAVDLVNARGVSRFKAAYIHAAGNMIVILLAIINWFLRSAESGSMIIPLGIGISAASVALLLITGWAGGELVYRHRMGVMARETDAAPTARFE